jgi:hypothetical protein
MAPNALFCRHYPTAVAMEKPQVLLGVSLALSFRAPTLQGIPQALELINDFLLPVAIDFAVYTDLQRVVKRYGLLELGHATRWTERLLRDDSISCSGSVTLEAKAAQPKLCLMRQPVATWTSSNGCSRTTGMCAN